jgi:hypothetical protein
MQTAGRLIMLLVGGLLMVTALFAFQRTLNQTIIADRRYDFTEEEIARGEHCKEQYRYSEVGLVATLKERMGNNLDGRVNLTIRNIDLGPLRSDGTHRLIATYNIDRIGETVGPAKLARGQVVNADCSVKITVFQN